jgi:hypothetical protein
MSQKIKECHFSLIKEFYDEIPDGLTSHRFKAWEYCYKYFHKIESLFKVAKNSQMKPY